MPIRIDISVNGISTGVGTIRNVSKKYTIDDDSGNYLVLLSQSGEITSKTYAEVVKNIKRKPYNIWKFLQSILDNMDLEEKE